MGKLKEVICIIQQYRLINGIWIEYHDTEYYDHFQEKYCDILCHNLS